MIWRVADEQFPGAIEIVDIYHAKQHLCDVAKAIYGAGTDLADQWARDRRAELDAGRLRAVVAALRTQTETTPEARRCIHYVFGNRHRIRYPQFRAKGLCISSGVVEAGCKQIGARFKRAGMRWTVAVLPSARNRQKLDSGRPQDVVVAGGIVKPTACACAHRRQGASLRSAPAPRG